MAIGNIAVLVQLDWPEEEDRIPPLMEQIQQRGSFHYYLFQVLTNSIFYWLLKPYFQSYIINVDILEELTYLWTNQITLDIVPHLG